ncbi:hypothetical protein B0H13DRAFT_2335363 [Mycena leptocephala]|nr:hypothetical protein B0H13DRAFT_2335363 [Mycena leptocephala]
MASSSSYHSRFGSSGSSSGNSSGNNSPPQYEGPGSFSEALDHCNVDPILVWESWKGSSELRELAEFAIMLLHVVANQAGCERTFSKVKVQQTPHRVRLKLDKLDKATKAYSTARSLKPRKPRNNRKSTANLLSVPRYRDLLDDQQDEDPSERGRALVSSPTGWRTIMAKWIGDAREAEPIEMRLPHVSSTWTPMKLVVIFGEATKPRARKPSRKAMEEEELLMQGLAEQEEDDIPDDGVIY